MLNLFVSTWKEAPSFPTWTKRFMELVVKTQVELDPGISIGSEEFQQAEQSRFLAPAAKGEGRAAPFWLPTPAEPAAHTPGKGRKFCFQKAITASLLETK